MPQTPNLLIIGAGGVAAAAAHKAAQQQGAFGGLCVASRRPGKCAAIVRAVEARQGAALACDLSTARVEARDAAAVGRLIAEHRADIVLNLASPHVNLAVMEACVERGAHYLDTALYEKEGEINQPAPWYANHEWRRREAFAAAGVTGILGIGFDPGAVNAFCAWVRKHRLATIDAIDILDVNGGDHGRYFATNFDAETNLREIAEDPVYWDGGWQRVACHSRSRVFDFPGLGAQRVYSMGHDEIHSLAVNFAPRRVEFWMGFGARYLEVFTVLKELGLLGLEPVDVEGQPVVPLKLVKALLPDPASLAAGYTGEVCIGALVAGRDAAGEARRLFVYSRCRHADARADVGAQAIAYTTAVPAVTAALLVARGDWRVGRLVNVEELDPDPFLALMPRLGIDWQVREEHPA